MKTIKFIFPTTYLLKKENLIRLYACLVLLSVILVQSCKNDNQQKSDPLSKYQHYLNQTAKNISQLTADRKESRLSVEQKLKATETYKMLVDSNSVSISYLPIFTLINNGLRSTYRDKKGGENMSIDQSLIDNVKNVVNGEDRLRFTINAISLSAPNKGGFPKELVQVFENYRKRYGLYGELGRVYMSNGASESLKHSFDMSSIFCLIKPTDKNLNSVYEANKNGISRWLDSNIDGLYIYPYLATKEGYFDFVKKEYPDSPYILKVDYELTAKSLYQSYKANEVSADESYKGKKIAVTGNIGSIGKDILDKPYVSLDVEYLQGVNCYFDKSSIKTISKLRKGEKITIIGVCKGLTITDVIMKDCEVWDE